MTLVTHEMRALIGIWSEPEPACDPIEQGAVRRFSQAIMDDDPTYRGRQTPGAAIDPRADGPIAPPLYPNHMMRRPPGTADHVQAQAHNHDFDGVVPASGLPPLRGLAHLPVLNGGSEFEFFRHARHGEWVTVRQRYADITEKSSDKGGYLIVVVLESEICVRDGEPLLRARRTLLRRAP